MFRHHSPNTRGHDATFLRRKLRQRQDGQRPKVYRLHPSTLRPIRKLHAAASTSSEGQDGGIEGQRPRNPRPHEVAVFH